MEYRRFKLSELGELKRGKSKHRPRNDKKLFGGEYPFIQTGEIKSAKWKVNKFEVTYNEFGLSQSRLWPKGTLCITIAANIAETAILNFPACFPDSVLGFIPYKNKANVYYVDYVIRNYKNKLIKSASQTAQKNINLKTFEYEKFLFPNIKQQDEIVSKIIPYEEKIMNNDFKINLLEEYSQLLFHKWFVDFNFPDKEGKPYKDNSGKMIQIDGKMIPEKWGKINLGKFVNDTLNGEWGKDDTVEGFSEVLCIRGADITNWNKGKIKNTPIRYIDYNKKGNKSLKNNDIVIEASGGSPTQSTGRTLLIRQSILKSIDKAVYCSNFCKVIRPKENYAIYLNCILKKLYNRGVFFNYEGKTTGIKNLQISSLLNNFKVINPPIELIKMFNNKIRVILDKINLLGKENELLEETRDLLIKKLIR